MRVLGWMCKLGIHSWKEELRNRKLHVKKGFAWSEADKFLVCRRCGKERFVDRIKWEEHVVKCVICGRVLAIGSNILTICPSCKQKGRVEVLWDLKAGTE